MNLRIAAFGFLFLVLVPISGYAAPRLAFVTSTWGNGNLSSWPGAAGATGLDAADAICQTKAQAANLPEPQAFVAWLSDRDNDAYCRLLGLGGKRADNCGSNAVLPEAGPWVRTDGLPFADSLSALVSGRVLSPLLLNEFGQRIAFAYESFTATNQDGTGAIEGSDSDCEQWTSGTLDLQNVTFALLGYNTGTTQAWTESKTGASCNGTRRLMCMQRGSSAPLPPRSAKGRKQAFVTETNVGSGNLMGLAGAHAICVTAASNAGLADPASFKALMASSYGGSASGHFQNTGPWYRLDGMIFAQSMAEITGGEVTTPLNVTELGNYVGYATAYTGATASGSPSPDDCKGWTSTSAGVAWGSRVWLTVHPDSGGHNWLSDAQVDCALSESPYDWPKKLYCLSDIDRIFFDDFQE